MNYRASRPACAREADGCVYETSCPEGTVCSPNPVDAGFFCLGLVTESVYTGLFNDTPEGQFTPIPLGGVKICLSNDDCGAGASCVWNCPKSQRLQPGACSEYGGCVPN